jgi:hypothetical protein
VSAALADKTRRANQPVSQPESDLILFFSLIEITRKNLMQRDNAGDEHSRHLANIVAAVGLKTACNYQPNNFIN